jgi:alkylresorcinol/alkylpyrone synthase
MAFISTVKTATPEYKLSLNEVIQFGDLWLRERDDLRLLFERFVRSSNTRSRGFVLSFDELLNPPGFADRAARFEEYAPTLGSSVLTSALQTSTIPKESFSTLVYTSCSCPTIPSVDGVIIERAELPRTISRVPIFQHGCAGGVIGLALASKLADTQGPVALVSVELCSLVFQPKLPSLAELVGAALFGDGAAACLLTPFADKDSLRIVDTESYLIPDSRHLMGYDLFDDGFHLRLDRELPNVLGSVTPTRVASFLSKHRLTSSDINYWLFHPGGVKILDYLEKTFSLTQSQCHWARDVLSDTGNISSATVLFVLERFLSENVCRPGEKVLMVGVGPGLTLELILFEMVGM